MECEKKELKKQVNRVALGIFLYNVILYLVLLADIIIKCVLLFMNYHSGPELDQKFEQLSNSIMYYGGSSIAGIFAGFLFLLFYFRKAKLRRRIFDRIRKPDVSEFCQILFVFLSAQFLFSLFSTGAEYGLNRLGYSMIGDIETASSTSSTISMFLYASFFGPVAEELVYRGFVLRSLERYGKVFAIVVSSVLFGVMHANLAQGVFAFFVGLVLAYVALEYSIYWSLLLHILNNCILSELWGYAVTCFPDTVQPVLEWGLLSVFFVGGCLVLWKNRQALAAYRKEHLVKRNYYKYAFTSVWMILFLTICFLLSILGIEKIS